MATKERMQLHLDPELVRWVREKAAKTKRSISQLFTDIILEKMGKAR